MAGRPSISQASSQGQRTVGLVTPLELRLSQERPSRVYQLKVTIKDTKPSVWRRLLVPENTTLLDLHGILQAAFGWLGDHLHEFEIDGERYCAVDDDVRPWEDPVRAENVIHAL